MTCQLRIRSCKRFAVFASFYYISRIASDVSAVQIECYGYLLTLIVHFYNCVALCGYRCRCIGSGFKTGIGFKCYGSIRAGCTRFIIRIGKGVGAALIFF